MYEKRNEKKNALFKSENSFDKIVVDVDILFLIIFFSIRMKKVCMPHKKVVLII